MLTNAREVEKTNKKLRMGLIIFLVLNFRFREIHGQKVLRNKDIALIVRKKIMVENWFEILMKIKNGEWSNENGQCCKVSGMSG